MEDYRAVNRANWDERAPAHAASSDYAVAEFLADPTFLSGVVRFDQPLLGDIEGLRGLHLQCHIGTDTLSLARLGAEMTGLDFSPPALAEARKLAAATRTSIDYVEADAYDAVEALGRERFELLYTGVGALCWLPSIERWADVVAALLTPGGRLFLREGHPMLWTLGDARPDGLLVVQDAYFERPEPEVYVEEGTYVKTDSSFASNTTHTWNHGLGETVTALLERGFRITGLAEHDSVPWDAFPGHMDVLDSGEFRIRERPWRLAHSYTLQAVRER
jgi:SAM-dependent methyltransferase